MICRAELRGQSEPEKSDSEKRVMLLARIIDRLNHRGTGRQRRKKSREVARVPCFRGDVVWLAMLQIGRESMAPKT